jgi:CheY-like chemotaxis protein
VCKKDDYLRPYSHLNTSKWDSVRYLYKHTETGMQDVFILIAEDDADDRFLLQAAFQENGFRDKLQFVDNGVELMEYLSSLTKGEDDNTLLPKFILLDLNMPKKDGREVLKEIKQHPELKKIPVVIFSTTNNEQEMRRCYELGANSYITKPNSFEHLLKIVANLRGYWMHTSSIPS